jgi:hypothetical protein
MFAVFDTGAGMPKEYRVVTANLGCGGPHGPAHEEDARNWLSTCDDVDLLLVQEAPMDWSKALPGFASVNYEGANQYRCRSFVAVRKGSGLTIGPLSVDTAAYHASYVAGAQVGVPDLGAVSLLSVHASPTRPSSSDRQRWRGSLPPVRPTGGTELWDSDFALETLGRIRAISELVLAAGDWNEARAWDDHHPGHWGREFFDAVDAADLVDCTHQRWKGERPTHRQYQDDHVFASPAVHRRIGSRMAIWPMPGSDHDAIAFTLKV